MIERDLRALVREAISLAHAAGELTSGESPIFEVTQPQRREHGDWTTNVAFVLTKTERKPPDAIARRIIEYLPARDWVREVEIAGKGFINFHLSNAWLHATCARVLEAGERFGATDEGAGRSANVEFVSANPTGPLTVAHGRHAAVGDSVARLMEFHGYKVVREYYFNDAGNQMQLLGTSVAARYLELLGRAVDFPEDGYQGEYIRDIAKEFLAQEGPGLGEDVLLIAKAREFAQAKMLRSIERTLAHMRVEFDVWSREQSFYDEGKVEAALTKLRHAGHVYEAEGAVWLRSSELGDSRDRVLKRSRGEQLHTYLAPDLAYHLDKAGRGFDHIIDIFGADHHAQVASLRAALPVLGVDPERLEFIIVQFVHLLRAETSVPMATRQGQFVTTDELLSEVGVDATRYTFLQTAVEHDVRFDIEEVKKQSLENPVYYVQYGHARIASILRHAMERRVIEAGDIVWDELHHEAEVELMRAIAGFEEVVLVAMRQRAPYRLTKYAEELARAFHRFYTECRVVTEDEKLTRARMTLCRVTKQVLSSSLGLLGVEAPDRMERVVE